MRIGFAKTFAVNSIFSEKLTGRHGHRSVDPEDPMLSRLGRTTSLLMCCVMAAFVLAAVQVSAQESNPKWDWFLGYQWANPGATVPVQGKLPSMSKGFGSSLTYNFDKNWGLEFDLGAGFHDKVDETTLSLGPRFMWRTEGMNLFAHALGGLNRAYPKALASNNGVGGILGGGMDMPLGRRVSWRVFEADYVIGRHNFFGFATPGAGLERPTFNGARLRTGLVFNFGLQAPVPPAASCSAQPSEVMVGEPVTVTASPSNFKKDHNLTYNWASTGGKVTSKEGTATVDTAGMSGGSYTATARVSDPKVKKGGEASCNASFSVKEPPKNPPVLSLSASPTSLQVGNPATITSDCKSPDGVPVTVGGWTASGGHLSGSGNSATLDTAGASAGTITVNATCTDSRGLTANGSTSVTAVNPPPPPPVVDKKLEARLALRSVYFPTAQPTVKNPSGGLVASQEQTLSELATDFKKYLEAKPDAHLTLEGHADVRGSVPYNQALSERRVARVRSYLVDHGVPDGNLDTKALGNQHNLTAAEVKASVDENSDLTKGERARVLRNMKTIIWASNRRVDVTLNTAGQTQTSVRHYPFNAADSLTLIGGREVPKAPAAKKATKKPAKKK
jgi:outer membrane protein OmpA-like peptidoglycan-associated protein